MASKDGANSRRIKVRRCPSARPPRRRTRDTRPARAPARTPMPGRLRRCRNRQRAAADPRRAGEDACGGGEGDDRAFRQPEQPRSLHPRGVEHRVQFIQPLIQGCPLPDRIGEPGPELVEEDDAEAGGEPLQRAPERRLLPHHLDVLGERRHDQQRRPAAELLVGNVPACVRGVADGRYLHGVPSLTRLSAASVSPLARRCLLAPSRALLAINHRFGAPGRRAPRSGRRGDALPSPDARTGPSPESPG